MVAGCCLEELGSCLGGGWCCPCRSAEETVESWLLGRVFKAVWSCNEIEAHKTSLKSVENTVDISCISGDRLYLYIY